MSVENPKPETTSIRLNTADRQLVDALKVELGLSASAEVLRMGLHALAKQHGLKG